MVRGMRGVGRVCEMCMCLARGGGGWLCGEWMRIGFGLYQSCGNRGSVRRVFVFGLQWCRWGLGPGSVRVRWCYVCCESGWDTCAS